MSQGSTSTAPDTDAPPRGRRAWLLPAVAAVVGLAVGFAAGAGGGNPTGSEEYGALSEQLTEVQAGRDVAEGEVQAAAARAREAAGGIADREIEVFNREAELDALAVELDAREASITSVEEQIAATTITSGTWTVGVDIAPGTYRTTSPVAGDCYWAIYRSGTNKGDIIQNDIVVGGTPTVTLSEGQDFESNRCGDWAQQ